MFDFFFRKANKNTALPNSLKVDLHAHLLPGIDDGAKNDEESLSLIHGLQSLGYQRCITTPHMYPGVHNNTTERIYKSLETLRALLLNQHISFIVDVAAEYFFDETFFRLIEQNDLLTFGNKYVLFELPFTNKPPMLDDIIFKMNLAGYQPVLAHPERYSFFHTKKMDEYEKLKNAGVLFQLNLMSLTGYYGEPAKRAARDLISKCMIDLAGTDLHRQKQLEVIAAAQKTGDYATLISSGKLLNEKL